LVLLFKKIKLLARQFMKQHNIKNQGPTEILHVNSKRVACDGSRDGQNAAAGHPLVYLDMGSKDFIVCPYCSKYFKLKK